MGSVSLSLSLLFLPSLFTASLFLLSLAFVTVPPFTFLCLFTLSPVSVYSLYCCFFSLSVSPITNSIFLCCIPMRPFGKHNVQNSIILCLANDFKLRDHIGVYIFSTPCSGHLLPKDAVTRSCSHYISRQTLPPMSLRDLPSTSRK